MSELTPYTPLTTKPKNDFPLVARSRGTEQKLHAMQVRFAGVDLEERKLICNMEAWEPQARIPELSRDLRVGIDSLRQMNERLADEPQQLQAELTALIEDYKKEQEPVPFISSDNYWLTTARLLLKGFEEFTGDKEISPGDLDFKELQRAYNDFF